MIGAWTAAWAQKQGLPIAHFKEIDSTLNYIKAELPFGQRPAAAPGTSFLKLVFADFQTAGRGRGDHVWVSPPAGTCLLSSWVWQTAKPVQPILAPLVGLALFRSLSAVFPSVEWSLKPPNDIYVREQKLAGVLIENISQGGAYYSIVSPALNVLASPSGDQFRATHLQAHTEVTQELWQAWLTRFWHELGPTLEAGQSTELGAKDRADLLSALNRFPHLGEDVLAVDALGQLQLKSRLIRWQDL